MANHYYDYMCVFTGLLTPLGEVPYTYLVKTMQGNTTQNISEHQPLILINNRAMLITFYSIYTFTNFYRYKKQV